jgi:NAD(P)-dependent dehydrogenase (short-subunit alcohol dehydrogenase family)
MPANAGTEEIRQAYIRMYEGMISKDEKVLNEVLDDSFVLVHMTGMRQPKQAFIKAVLNGTLNYFSAEHENMPVEISGDTAVLLEEVGKVIAEGGAGVTISSQSGWRMPQLTPEEDRQLAMTPTEELLGLPLLQPENIRDTLHAYQLAKRCNEKRVMYECIRWGERGARLNDIAPGIIVTPLAVDEFNGPRGDFYKNMFAKCPAGRPGTADEMANIAELLMSDAGAFITGSTFLADGGATASYYYGPLQP